MMLLGCVIVGIGFGLINMFVINMMMGVVLSVWVGMVLGIDMSVWMILFVLNIVVMGFVLVVGIVVSLKGGLVGVIGDVVLCWFV